MKIFLGKVIHCVRNNGSEEFIDFGHISDGTVIRFSKDPIVYTKGECKCHRNRMVSDLGFDKRPYPFGIDQWQTADVFMDSQY